MVLEVPDQVAAQELLPGQAVVVVVDLCKVVSLLEGVAEEMGAAGVLLDLLAAMLHQTRALAPMPVLTLVVQQAVPYLATATLLGLLLEQDLEEFHEHHL